eukprot:2683183-Rhodomonas_salina.3
MNFTQVKKSLRPWRKCSKTDESSDLAARVSATLILEDHPSFAPSMLCICVAKGLCHTTTPTNPALNLTTHSHDPSVCIPPAS